MLYARTRKPEDQGKPSFFFFFFSFFIFHTKAAIQTCLFELLSKSTSRQVKHAVFEG